MKKKTSNGIPIVLYTLIGLFGLIFLTSYLFSSRSMPTLSEYINEKSNLTPIIYPNGKIFAKIATSSEDLERGLGMTKSLPTDEGMLFVFHELGQRGFWMKNMAFPIDIVWINKDKVVVGTSQDISPETYPNIFFPPEPVMYVLELNSGYVRKNEIATGTPLTFVI